MTTTDQQIAERLYQAAEAAIETAADAASERGECGISHASMDKIGPAAMCAAGLREAVERLERIVIEGSSACIMDAEAAIAALKGEKA